MKKEWNVSADGRKMSNVDIVDTIMRNRGIKDIDVFLQPNSDFLLESEQLKNIELAFKVISDGIESGKSMLIYADVDLDGCSSGAIMYRYLSNFTDNLQITINEYKQHGVNPYVVTDNTPDIIIVVDSINEKSEYNKFVNAGKSVIVLDHHIIPSSFDTLSDNPIVVSSANNYPNSQLSGAGVCWKFCKYCDEMYLTDYADDLVDLATCGIIGDMCSMKSMENRYICSQGFKNMKNLAISKIVGGYDFNAQAVSFSIAPLVNAANRLNYNTKAVQIFLSDDEDEIKTLIKELKKIKDEQNVIADNLMADIHKQSESQLDNKVMRFIVDTNASLSGLIANKLIEQYQRPVFVLRDCGDVYGGSARGIGVKNLLKIVESTGLANGAGHEEAFGIEISKDNYADFIREMNRILSDTEFVNKKNADIQLDLTQIDDNLINNFKYIDKISGEGFSSLKVCVKDIVDYEVSQMSNGKHLKIVTDDLIIIKWNFTGDWNEFGGKPISVIGSLASGYFGKTYYRQIIIDDYKVG